MVPSGRDVPPQPGWWRATDGNWYPPQSAAPIDAKSARAAAKASKAHAKALRPWYKKKRFVFSGLIVILIVIVLATAGGKKSPNAASSGGGNKNPAECTARPPVYPDHQTTDCVALPNGGVGLADTVVTATWAKAQGDLGDASICATVSIKNNTNSTISYDDLYWKLQTPSGKVEDTNLEATKDLGSGDLVSGGTAAGTVCFDDPGQTGTYVGIYKPDPFNPTRGIWLFPST